MKMSLAGMVNGPSDHHLVYRHQPHVRTDTAHHPYHMERKLKKPLMEKKRRARINDCLGDLKQLLLQAAPHQRSKLEKADILEMTVQYLRRVTDNKQTHDLTVARQAFLEGYTSCASSVVNYLESDQSSSSQLRASMVTHMNKTLTSRLQQTPPPPPPSQLNINIPPGITAPSSAAHRLNPLPTPPYFLPPTKLSPASVADQQQRYHHLAMSALDANQHQRYLDGGASPVCSDASSSVDVNSLSPMSEAARESKSPAAVWRPW